MQAHRSSVAETHDGSGGQALPWDPTALPRPTRDLHRLKADIDSFGYCLVDRALPPDTVAAVRDRLAEQAAAERQRGRPQCARADAGQKPVVRDPDELNQWVSMLVNKGKVFQALLPHPIASAVVKHLLGPGYLLGDMSGPLTRPGNPVLPLHIDQYWMPSPAMPGEPYVRAGSVSANRAPGGPPEIARTPINPPLAVNCMFMISDFTEDNGATRMVPRSHLSGIQPEPCVPHKVPTVAATGAAGDLLIWEGRTWHAAGANVSDEIRYGLVTFFSGPQIRGMWNYTLGTKAEVLEGASPELIALLGFKVWGDFGRTVSADHPFARPAKELIGELKP